MIAVLKYYKNTIGWTIVEIIGLSPTPCMPKIRMEEDLMPREAKQKLNPSILEVEKNNVMKL